jgi:hypothetical protein
MPSLAQPGRGTTIGIGAVPTTIGEVKSITRSGYEWKTEDVSNMSTSTRATEKIATIFEQGTVELAGNRISSDAGQALLEAAELTGAATAFTVTLPKASGQTVAGDVYTFNAIVISAHEPADLDVAKSIQFKAKLDITGDVTFTIGH